MNKLAERPPILLFLMLFTGLLAVALGLAAIAPPPPAAAGGPEARPGESLAQPAADQGLHSESDRRFAQAERARH